MKFSINWLCELIEGLQADPKDIGVRITIHTAEQEGVEPHGEHLARVCTARVVSAEPIPGSRNRKALVETGRYGTKTVVCGAPNCREGILTAYVPAGTSLPGGKRIETATIAGVFSDGMLASGSELGLNRDDSGILELSGEPGAPVAWLDHILEIDNKSLTHRPDLWGHYGLAREVAAIYGRTLQDPVDMSLLPGQGSHAVSVSIEDYAVCPRYSALAFENVTVQPSPLWLQQKLEAIGLNPINNIVDVTNYVMAELAQPMHAFDRDTLAGETIFVRLARSGERIVALNQERYDLDPQSLVIADANGPVAVAGVIGGLDTGVTAKTTRLVFESANFHPGHIRKTASRLKCRTDASMRFEKSQDPRNTVRALARAVALLREVSPGIRLVGGLADNCGPLRPAPVIDLPLGWLRRKLGRDIGAAEVRRILESIGFGVEQPSADVLRVTVPSWRATKDIAIKDDLVEEVGRMVGYGTIAPLAPLVPAAPPPPSPERDFLHRIRHRVAAQGFTEVYNYSFVNEDQIRELELDLAGHVRVLNPIASDQGLLRTTLMAGVLRNVRDNARHASEFRFFEIGHEIHKRPDELPREDSRMAACVFSHQGDGLAGLFEAKRLAECLLPGAAVTPCAARPFEHPHRSHAVKWRGADVGRIFEFHPNLVEGRAAVVDLHLDRIGELGSAAVKYTPLRRFPTSAFDLSVVTGLRELVGNVEGKIRQHGGEHFQNVEFVRQYTGQPLPDDRKSVSFRVTVGAADRTLSNDEISKARAALIDALRGEGYELRV